MLLHRLPLDAQVAPDSLVEEAGVYVEHIARVRVNAANLVLACLDVIGCMFLAGVIFGSTAGVGRPQTALTIVSALAASAAWFAISGLTGLYHRNVVARGANVIWRAARTACIAFTPIMILSVAYGLLRGVNPSAVPLCTTYAFAWIIGLRVIWFVWLRALIRSGRCIDRIIVLGPTLATAAVVAAQLERQTAGRLRAVARIALREPHGATPFEVIGDTILGKQAEQIIIADYDASSGLGKSAALRLVRQGCDVTLISLAGTPQRLSSAQPDFVILNAHKRPLSKAQTLVKRAIDIAVACAALLIAFPILIVIGIMIKLDSPGPVLFRQKRHGLNTTTFAMWKFRSMCQPGHSGGGAMQTSRDDPRVTRVGRWLRKTSIDEMPQLLNVLCGDMSIVGPRPHACSMTVGGRPLTAIMENYHTRHRVKPGITGWAQVHGSRGLVDGARALRRRVALDSHYIENWSFRMDVIIILRTVRLMVRDAHAF